MKIKARTWLLDEIRPNSYNYNVQDAFTFSKEVNSIRKYGFLVPLTVRNAEEESRGTLRDIADRIDGLMTPDQLSEATKEVTDGEHRWKALMILREGLREGEYTAPDDLHQLSYEESEKRAGQWVHKDGSPLGPKEIVPDTAEILKSGEVPVSDLEDCPVGEAMKLTVILNETKGSPDYEALSTLVAKMTDSNDIEDLVADLPFSGDQMTALIEEMNEETLESLFESLPGTDEEETTPGSGFQRFEVVMPNDAFQVYQQVRERIEEKLAEGSYNLHPDPDIAHGQIIEALSAEYAAGRDA